MTSLRMWCSILVRRYAVSSTTIKGAAASTEVAHGRGLGGRARLTPAECGGAKRGPTHERCARLASYIARGLTAVHDVQEALRVHVDDGWAIQATLASDGGPCAERQAPLQVLQEQCRTSDNPI